MEKVVKTLPRQPTVFTIMAKKFHEETFRDSIDTELKSKRLKCVASWKAAVIRTDIQSSDNKMNKWIGYKPSFKNVHTRKTESERYNVREFKRGKTFTEEEWDNEAIKA